MNQASLLHRWWRHWLHQRPAAPDLRQRLVGFEPLEQRTVLSGMSMMELGQGREFVEPRIDAYRSQPMGQDFAGHADSMRGLSHQTFADDAYFVAARYEPAAHGADFAPHDYR